MYVRDKLLRLGAEAQQVPIPTEMGNELHHPEAGKQHGIQLPQEFLLLLCCPLLRMLLRGGFDGRRSIMNHC